MTDLDTSAPVPCADGHQLVDLVEQKCFADGVVTWRRDLCNCSSSAVTCCSGLEVPPALDSLLNTFHVVTFSTKSFRLGDAVLGLAKHMQCVEEAWSLSTNLPAFTSMSSLD